MGGLGEKAWFLKIGSSLCLPVSRIFAVFADRVDPFILHLLWFLSRYLSSFMKFES